MGPFRLFLAPAALAAALLLPRPAPAQEVRRFARADRPGQAWAVRIDDARLAYTGPVLPWEPSGAIKTGASAQAARAVANLEAILAAAGTDAAHIVRINAYVRDDDASSAIDAALASAFASNPPVVTLVRSALGQPGALVALDAIARMPGTDPAVRRLSLAPFPGATSPVRVGLLPAGRKVFISGEAAKGKDFDSSVGATLAALARDLEYLGLDKADVVQVKAVVQPFPRRHAMEWVLADFFAGSIPPPLVLVEGGPPGAISAEIEMTASGARWRGSSRAAVAYDTFPGHARSTRFSSVAIVAPGVPLIFVAGLEGSATANSRGQIGQIFSRLGEILFETGGSFGSLAKSTAYYTDKAGGKALSEVRGVYYNPAAPPASTNMQAFGVGRPGKTCMLDEIGAAIVK